MKKNILITGGAGYIGSILTEKLLDLDYKVTVYDNFLYKQSSLTNLCHKDNLTIYKGDVRNIYDIKNFIKNSDIIIPLAALVGAPICNFDPVGSKSINHDSIDILLDNVSKEQLILMPTTNSAYGSGDANNYCDENSPLNPISEYAKEKVNVENKLLNHENSISFRLATVFGMSPRMRIDLLVNDFVLRALKDKFMVLFEGSFKRNFIHIRDVCHAFIHGIENFSKMRSNIYNVGLSEANLSKIELCNLIKIQIPDFVFFEEKIHKDQDQRNYIVSNEKIEKTGFKPGFTIEMGIKELIKGYQILNTKNYSNI